ncbi:hypothetical protein BDN70DRAFT_899639 [Pholiota conissans]|uniref:DUF6532 domain-containing protein n=1 Tax=Pholiota conissans TaxID=109636 RepID=A0A9P5YPP4_9AGAR|nr:hypothetical protein BDN70DRAFT_899639 [Pholiota conissans]
MSSVKQTKTISNTYLFRFLPSSSDYSRLFNFPLPIFKELVIMANQRDVDMEGPPYATSQPSAALRSRKAHRQRYGYEREGDAAGRKQASANAEFAAPKPAQHTMRVVLRPNYLYESKVVVAIYDPEKVGKHTTQPHLFWPQTGIAHHHKKATHFRPHSHRKLRVTRPKPEMFADASAKVDPSPRLAPLHPRMSIRTAPDATTQNPPSPLKSPMNSSPSPALLVRWLGGSFISSTQALIGQASRDADIEVVGRAAQQGSDLPASSDTDDLPASIQVTTTQGRAQAKHGARQEKVKYREIESAQGTKACASDKRNDKFKGERSTIVSASPQQARKHKKCTQNVPAETEDGHASDAGATSDDDVVEVDLWPSHARFHGDGLCSPNPYLRTICKKAIQIAESVLVTEHTWPELNKASEYHVPLLAAAAKYLENQGPEYRDIRKRVGKDDDFAARVGRWVLDRLSHARSPCISPVSVMDALSESAPFWDLGSDAGRLGAGASWSGSSTGKGYLNISITNVLRLAFFASSTALGHCFSNKYNNKGRRELTIPLVALAATGVYAALSAWSNGDYHRKPADCFDGETFAEVYNRHARVLEELQNKHLNIFQAVMGEIYQCVIGNDGQQVAEQSNALASWCYSG